MVKGVYDSAAAMLAALLRQDVHAENLANVETVGFKRCLARAVTSAEPGGWATVLSRLDTTPGDVRPTGAPLDVALRGRGYFVLETPLGRQYTRNGHFALSADGYLVNSQGCRVMGERGPIALRGARAEIAADGAVYSDGRLVDRLLVVDFPAREGLRAGPGSLVTGGAARQVTNVTLEPRALEASNVNPIQEMVEMRSGLRAYEANARIISQIDRTLAKLIEAATA